MDDYQTSVVGKPEHENPMSQQANIMSAAAFRCLCFFAACSELMEMTDRSAWTTKNRFDEGLENNCQHSLFQSQNLE